MLLNLATNRRLQILARGAVGTTFSQDGTRLALIYSSEVTVLDAQSGVQICRLEALNGQYLDSFLLVPGKARPVATALSPNVQQLLTVLTDGYILFGSRPLPLTVGFGVPSRLPKYQLSGRAGQTQAGHIRAYCLSSSVASKGAK